MNDIDKKLFKNLNDLIVSPDLYFDEGIAKYILERLGEQKLREYKIPISVYTSSVGEVYSNIYGLVYILRSKADNLENSHYSENKKRFHNAVKAKEDWDKLLSDISPDLLNHPEYYLKMKKEDKESSISYGLLMILSDLELWFEKQKNDDNYKLKDNEIDIFIKNFYTNESLMKRYSFSIDNKELLNFIVDNTISSFEYLRKKEAKTKVSMLNTLLNLDNFNNLLNLAPEKMLVLFENNIDLLIKKANVKDSYIKSPELLSKYLKLMDRDLWKKNFFKDGEYSLLSLCGKSLSLLTGYSHEKINMMLKDKVSVSVNTINLLKTNKIVNEIIDRIKLIEDEKDLIPNSEIEKMFLYASKTSKVELLRGLIEIFELPPRTEDNVFLYKMLDSGKYLERESSSSSKEVKVSFSEIEAEYYKNKLEKELPISKTKSSFVKI